MAKLSFGRRIRLTTELVNEEQMFEYRTIEEEIMESCVEKVILHALRVSMYLEHGKVSFAHGSMIKCLRWQDRYAEYMRRQINYGSMLFSL
jgi:hypothetical protein